MRRFFLVHTKKRNGPKKSFCEVCRWGQNFPKTGKKKIFSACGAKGKPLTNPWADQGFLDPENNN